MKTILSFLSFVFFFGFANAQSSKIPDAVKTKFKTDYPNVSNAKWGVEGSSYEAEWTANGVETSVTYNGNGALLETETSMKVSDLLPAITTYINTNVSGKKISEASKIVDASGKITYEAEAGGKDYIFDDQGNFIKVD